MRFQVCRASQGSVSKTPPCKGAVPDPNWETAWPGEHAWFIELATLEELMTFLDENGGALGLFTPEGGEPELVIEIFDDDEADG